MSRLARLTKVIADAVPGHAAVLSDEGVPAWVRHHGDLGDRLIGEGDLILDLSDMADADQFVATRVLDRWAAALDFSLRGIDRREAIHALASRTLQREFVAAAPSVDAFGRCVPAKDSRIRVHRDAVIHILVQSFDGPFADNHVEFWDAVKRRLGPTAAWAYTR
ncbi:MULTISPECIES: hypothetical protein [unclassified Microbacterium]|uniref:hypothetical protein n=1 Tax=unclassified Microbacterium TaxID=2609290 RepID=UPI00109CB6BD|nr:MULTISPECIES: hypothetical protein [unclassified Microbacterium]